MKLFQSTIEQYRALEPKDADTWSPLLQEKELWHRTRLLQQTREALVASKLEVHKSRFLDVGCGVGRSTRCLLEFGIGPSQLVGLDLRRSAIETARRMHSEIDYVAIDSLDEYTAREFDWVMQCTVFSSLPTQEERHALAAFMLQCTKPGGFIFWWDRCRANSFAGGDALAADSYFPDCELVHSNELSTRPMLRESLRSTRLRARALSIFQRILGFAPTHRATLFRKPVE